MALNGSVGVVVTSQNSLWFNWWQISQSVENNSTTIGWNLVLTSGASGTISSSSAKAWWVNVNGSYYEGTTTVGINNNSEKTLASGSTVISHNTDGTKEFPYSFSQYFGINWGGTRIESKGGSGTGTLEPIARQALLTSTPANINDEQDSVTIYYTNPVEASRLSKLAVCIGIGWDVLTPYEDVSPYGTSYIYKLDETKKNLLRSAVLNGTTNDNIYFYIGTWTTDGGFYLDREQTTLTILNATPLVSLTLEDDNPVTKALVGNKQKFIYGESHLKFEVDVETRKGATLRTSTVKCGDYTSSDLYGTIEYITPSYNDYSISCRVVDSKSNIGSVSVPLDMVWYMRPECYLEQDSLSTSSGNLYFNVRCYWLDGYFDGTNNGSDGGVKNEANLQYRYRLEDGEYGEWFDADPSGISYDPENFIENNFNEYMWKVGISGLDYTSTYKVQLRLLDKVATAAEATISDEYTMNMIPVFDWSREDFAVNVPTRLNDGLYLLDNEGNHSEVMKYADNGPDAGYGLNIGYDNFSKALNSEAGPGDIQYDTTLHGNNVKITPVNDLYLTPTYGQVYINLNPLNDFVIEQGESDGWFYRKWNSGIAECWKIYYENGVNAAATYYNGFYYSPTISVPFPFTFANLPTVTVDGGSSSNMNFVRTFGKYQDAASFVVVGLANVTSTNITVDIKAIGRWY